MRRRPGYGGPEPEAGEGDDLKMMRSAMEFLIGEIQRLEGRVRDVLLGLLRESPLRAMLYPDAAAFDGEMRRPRPRIVSRHVRKVEQYIRPTGQEAISIRKLCAATGVPPRTLFQLFRAERGYTPMWFPEADAPAARPAGFEQPGRGNLGSPGGARLRLHESRPLCARLLPRFRRTAADHTGERQRTRRISPRIPHGSASGRAP